MKLGRSGVAAAGMALLVIALLVAAFFIRPEYPVALIRVVDAAGKPIKGAVVQPDGMRTKPGPYESGHYGWHRSTNGPPAMETRTDAHGETRVPYPQYVFERIETGQISFSVAHPDFVPDRPFRVVTTRPPAGAPWKVWANYWLDRAKHRALVSRTEPVVLQRGAIVKLNLAGPEVDTTQLYAQISGGGGYREGFWTNSGPNVVESRQVQPGPHLVRLVQFDPEGVAWFSEAVPVNATTNQASEAQLQVKRGVDLAGKLDPAIPRPIKHGRVIAHVTPPNTFRKDSPPEWHAWSETDEEGNFRFKSLPSGSLEISAICDGFISTNGPGRFSSRCPQRHEIGTNDLSIVIGMERTARIEVTVIDQGGKPVPDAKIYTWPNIRYGEWSSTVFASDCYNTADMLKTRGRGVSRWSVSVPDFEGNSDANGVAIVPNVPDSAKEFAVHHHAFQLPATDDGDGRKTQEVSIKLVAGETNRVTVRMEPSGASQIAHY